LRWHRTHLQRSESVLTVLCRMEFIGAAARALDRVRGELESYLPGHPGFASSFVPLQTDSGAPEVVRAMCRAAEQLNVGPMAAVAGAIAERVLTAVRSAGAREVVVDNGGDICFLIEQPVSVGIWTGAGEARGLALLIEPRDEPFAICTSSGVVGHSFSYGRADAATVLSGRAALADAAATALGNRVRTAEDLEHAFDPFDGIEDLCAALCFVDGRIALWGEVPRLVRAELNPDLITRGKKHGKSEMRRNGSHGGRGTTFPARSR